MLRIRAFGRRDASIIFYELFFGHLLKRLKKKEEIYNNKNSVTCTVEFSRLFLNSGF